jgi:hypothetical protein
MLWCCALVPPVALLAASPAMATGNTCASVSFSFTVVQGPCLIKDPASPECGSEGDYTAIQYRIGGSSADHVFILASANSTVVVPPALQVYPPGAGCSTTELGKDVKHLQCVKVNPNAATRTFWLVVAGKKTPIPTTVAAKKGSCLKSAAIMGFGNDSNAFQAINPTEVVAFKKCKVEFVKDPVTGEVLDGNLTPDSPEGCRIYKNAVEDMTVTVPGAGDVGVPKFGDGYVSSGTNSCITRVIGGRVYTWGDPCPD